MAQRTTQAAVAVTEAGAAAPARRRAAAGDAVRERVKAKAVEMFIRRGFNAVTFIDIGRDLGIPHSLIHYHFGSKSALAEEVLNDFSDAGMGELAAIWEAPDTSLLQKFSAGRDRLYHRFLQFNPDGVIAHAPGLVSRFSLEFEAITPAMQEIVKATHERTDRIILNALEIAVERGELVADCPKDLLMLQIGSAFFVPGPTAHYGWTFERLDDLLRSVYVTLMGAFGTERAAAEAWAPLDSRLVRGLPAHLKPRIRTKALRGD